MYIDINFEIDFPVSHSACNQLHSFIPSDPRMITKTKLPIGIDRHCVAGNNAHWLMQRGYNTGKTDMMGRTDRYVLLKESNACRKHNSGGQFNSFVEISTDFSTEFLVLQGVPHYYNKVRT